MAIITGLTSIFDLVVSDQTSQILKLRKNIARQTEDRVSIDVLRKKVKRLVDKNRTLESESAAEIQRSPKKVSFKIFLDSRPRSNI